MGKKLHHFCFALSENFPIFQVIAFVPAFLIVIATSEIVILLLWRGVNPFLLDLELCLLLLEFWVLSTHLLFFACTKKIRFYVSVWQNSLGSLLRVNIVVNTGAKSNFLSRNSLEFDVWKMWILWKMYFENVNFVKNEFLKLWILTKMRFWNCEFLN